MTDQSDDGPRDKAKFDNKDSETCMYDGQYMVNIRHFDISPEKGLKQTGNYTRQMRVWLSVIMAPEGIIKYYLTIDLAVEANKEC